MGPLRRRLARLLRRAAQRLDPQDPRSWADAVDALRAYRFLWGAHEYARWELIRRLEGL